MRESMQINSLKLFLFCYLINMTKCGRYVVPAFKNLSCWEDNQDGGVGKC